MMDEGGQYFILDALDTNVSRTEEQWLAILRNQEDERNFAIDHWMEEAKDAIEERDRLQAENEILKSQILELEQTKNSLIKELKDKAMWLINRLHGTHSINGSWSNCDYNSCISAKALIKDN